MPQHMRMQRKWKIDQLPCSRKHLSESGRRYRRSPLSQEDVPRLWLLTQQSAKRPQLDPAKRMNACRSALDAPYVEQAPLEINLIPAQCTKLGYA
jgi:hypothetical protein